MFMIIQPCSFFYFYAHYGIGIPPALGAVRHRCLYSRSDAARCNACWDFYDLPDITHGKIHRQDTWTFCKKYAGKETT